MVKEQENKSKKFEFYSYLILKLALDILVAWYAWDYYKAHNKVMLYGLVGGYLLIRLIFAIRGLKRRKLKRQFNELFPED